MSDTGDEAAASSEIAQPYTLYLLECAGGRFYAGIARDVEKRFAQHQAGKGAAFTRGWPPVRILATKVFGSKGEALSAEYQLKQLPKARKLGFFEVGPETAGECAPRERSRC
ncbi:MAG: GIY-YIG nuclease family protein [Caldisericota bacterium]|nr:GIY-YIG nuclease family protein [Caldisericota bacterium]